MAIQPGQIHHQRYKFERLIGRGAFGETWEGYHLFLQRQVAIKVIDASRLDDGSQERAIRECQIGGRLSSTHIVNVLDAYREAADLCIVMEFMAGGSLKEYLTRQPPGFTQGLHWGLDLAEALLAVHAAGIVHRDVKPANILLTETGQVKIADFGIAHLPGSDLTGQFQPGTPAYRSPEQEQNEPVDAATDVYALSAVLFEVFTREKFYPYKGITPTEWPGELRQILARQYPDAPPEAVALLAEALAGGLNPHRPARSTLDTLRQQLAQTRDILTGLEYVTQPPPASPAPSAEMPLDLDRERTPLARIDRYELQALIGRGGMGSVHKAYDPKIDRLVALKTITIVDPSWRARFQQEVRIAGRLNHPHIVTVYDVGELGQIAYIVMELIEGQTLADLLPARMPWAEAIKLVLPVCQALEYAHRQGVVHRDIKPANILLAADNRVKLTDFGIARLETGAHLTQTGAIIGTPLYMAPEQLQGQNVDARADIFSLGVLLFELLTGQNPFAQDRNVPKIQLLLRTHEANFNLLHEVAPLALQAVVRRAMAEKPAARFSAAEMNDALLSCLVEPAPPDMERRAGGYTTAAFPQVEIDNNVVVSDTERELITTAFTGYDRVYLERELSEPHGSPRLLVALPVRSGRTLTRVIIKLASPEILSREWLAYQDYVAEVLPQVTAHILGAPLLAADRKLALLRYTFTGDVGERGAENFIAFYASKTGAEIAALLERNIFQVVAPNWWLNRQTMSFAPRREYDHLLPPHLEIEQFTETSPSLLILKAGVVTLHELRDLKRGQPVQAQGFRVKSINPAHQEMILEAPAAAGGSSRVRLRLTRLEPDELRYQPGDLVPNFSGIVSATRQEMLACLAQPAFPNTDLTQPTLTLNKMQFPNPLREYGRFLDQPVTGMRSTIHGNLTLDSILIEPVSGLTWLINFADTRQGHNLYDFVQIEVQVVTRLLSDSIRLAGASIDEQVIGLLRVLHTSHPPEHAPQPVLQKPYDLLKTVRRLAGRCMLDPDNWDEYYLALTVMVLGALVSMPDNPAHKRLLMAWAAVSANLVGQPLYQSVTATDQAASATRPIPYMWLALGLAGVTLAGAGFLAASGLTAAPTPTAIVAQPTATTTPSFTASATPTQVFTATPTPGEMAGILTADLNVYIGPGEDYDYVDYLENLTEVMVTGRNQTGDWWHVAAADLNGWVRAEFVKVAGTPILPLMTAPPPPIITSTPTNTATPTATSTATATATGTPRPPTATLIPTPTGSPTPGANVPRQLINDTPAYQTLDNQVMAGLDPSSAAFAPNGRTIAATEGIKLYTFDVNADGNSFRIWTDDGPDRRPVEGIVWSPNGQLLAFVSDRKQGCVRCRQVGVLVRASGSIFYLEAPDDKNLGLPRWTLDGRLMVTIYEDDPAAGIAYVFDANGQGQLAVGSYILSSSLEGQKWWPWLPGKSWQVGQGAANSYYAD